MSNTIGHWNWRWDFAQPFSGDWTNKTLIFQALDSFAQWQFSGLDGNYFTYRSTAVRNDDFCTLLYHFDIFAQVHFRIPNTNTGRLHFTIPL